MIIAMLEDHASSEIGCSECGQVLFRKDQLFTVSGASGLVGSYVNSFGYGCVSLISVHVHLVALSSLVQHTVINHLFSFLNII